MTTTHVVWDWNGTLFDDLPCCVDVIDRVLGEFGLTPLGSVAAYQGVFRFPIRDYYAAIGFDTSPAGNFDAAAHRYMELYAAASADCGLHAGATEALASVTARGVTQVVVSASHQDNLTRQLAPFALDRWVAEAHGIEDIYAASKAHVAERWLAASGADPRRVVFVGDSEHDHEIADALGCRSVLFSGGHHARAHLEGLGAPVVDDLGDVLAHL